MGKLKNIEIKGKEFKILEKLHYRLACKVEILNIEMMKNCKIDLNEAEEFEPQTFQDLDGLDFSKKVEIMDLLLTEAVKFPKITVADLDDEDHELNPYFKDLGDELMVLYMIDFQENATEKKKLTT